MMSISAADAFDAYEAARDRLPAARTALNGSRRLTSLAALADRFDVFLLDAFGVLNIGDTAIPGTPALIEDLRKAGKKVLVVSNAASQQQSDIVGKYRRLGYSFESEDVVTSRATLIAELKSWGNRHWGAMALANDSLNDLGLPHITVLGDDPAPYADVEGFLLIGSGSWTEPRQALLEAALGQRPRPVLVANPDIAAPREGGFSAEPGHFAHRLADSTGVTPAFFGKPFGNIFDLALSRVGEIDRSRILMVGDSLHTDVLGAQTAGIPSALIADYGFFAGHNVQQAIDAAGIVPDYVLDRP